MADFTTADLEGANELLNKTLTDAKALKDSLVAQHGADASTMLADVESKVTDLISSVSNMIPELPTIPNVNMQGEFAALADIDISTQAGLEQFTAQTANITSQFGTAMADKGLDIDSLATQIQSGGKDLVGDLLPNLQLPDGESLPIELPSNIKIPSKESLKETLTSTPTLETIASDDALAKLRNAADNVVEEEKTKTDTPIDTPKEGYTVVSTGEIAGIKTVKTTTTTTTTTTDTEETIPPEGTNRKKKTKTYNLLGGIGSPRKWKKYPASYPNYPGASGRYVGYQRRGWDDDKIARRQKKEEDRLFLRAERGQTIYTRNQQFDELGNWRKDTNGFIYYDIRYNRKKMVKT